MTFGDPSEIVAMRIVEGRAVPVTREVADRINRGELASFNLRYSLDPRFFPGSERK